MKDAIKIARECIDAWSGVSELKRPRIIAVCKALIDLNKENEALKIYASKLEIEIDDATLVWAHRSSYEAGSWHDLESGPGDTHKAKLIRITEIEK